MIETFETIFAIFILTWSVSAFAIVILMASQIRKLRPYVEMHSRYMTALNHCGDDTRRDLRKQLIKLYGHQYDEPVLGPYDYDQTISKVSEHYERTTK